MKYIIGILAILTMFSCKEITLEKGNYRGALVIDNEQEIPFILHIRYSGDEPKFIILNGFEKINLQSKRDGNEWTLKFPSFDSELIVKAISKTKLKGQWHNYAKGDYTMPVYINKGLGDYQTAKSLETTVEGKWEVHFSEGKEDEWPAIGIFNQNKKEQVRGTFRTETGDYRFLEGILSENQFRLSCFDGAHAFLFTAQLKKDVLEDGIFYSGKHYQTNWIAYRNEDIELENPETLTALNEEVPFKFNFPSHDFQDDIIFPSAAYKDKVVIVQILGSWCPNCMDESRFYSSLYNKYNRDGLEIIGVAFEIPEAEERITSLLSSYKKDLGIKYPITYGGKANKKIAGEKFPMLEHVVSFPTSIILDNSGKVRKIHTGFNGPSTGTVYSDYKIKTVTFIEELLAE